MYLSQHKLGTRKTELHALKMKFCFDFRRVSLPLTNGSDVNYVFPPCHFRQRKSLVFPGVRQGDEVAQGGMRVAGTLRIRSRDNRSSWFNFKAQNKLQVWQVTALTCVTYCVFRTNGARPWVDFCWPTTSQSLPGEFAPRHARWEISRLT